MKRFKALLWLPVPFLLYWALRDIRFARIAETLGRLTLPQLSILLAVNLGFLAILTLRWTWVLHGLGRRLEIWRLASYRLAGYAVSYITPGPHFGGEPVQLYLARKRSGLTYDLGSASILLDKTFELLGNFTFLGVAALAILLLDLLPAGNLRLALPLPSLLIVAPAGYLAALFLGVEPLSRVMTRLPAGFRRRPGVIKFESLLRSSEGKIVSYCRRRGRTLLQILVFFLLVWSVSFLEMHLVLRFLGLPVSAAQTLLILTGGKLAFLLPFPGALGALELTQTAVFQLLGYPAEAGMSLVLYVRARDLLFASIGLIVIAAGTRKGRAVNS